MGIFNNKKLDDLEKRIAKLEAQDFRLDMERLKTEFLSLRGLVNRKLATQDLKEEDPLKRYGF